MKQKPMEELKKRLLEVTHLSSILAVLGWDQEVYMPVKGADARAAATAHLASLTHTAFIDIDKDGLLTDLKKDLDTKKIKGQDAVIVSETWNRFEREKKLPEAFVRELTEVASKAQTVWQEARAKNDFSLYLPWLAKIVKLKKKEAELVGYKQSPYDAMLDIHEPGMTTEEASQILNDLKDFLVPFLKKIRAAKIKIDKKRTQGKFPANKQFSFNKYLAERIGFDLEAGRIDASAHPFTTNFHPQDVRITTRYRAEDLLYSIGSTIHETGHALYEQGIPAEHFGTPLGEYVSLGIHESQSRLWENNIGKSRSFWKYFYPKLQKEFPVPFKTLSLDEFYKIINEVKPSLIRTEADEVTYNLHIIIRYEIEKEMMEGQLDLKQLPAIWNSKMKEYFGISVPSDSLGILQDVHWSHGSIGYFPTYTLGNLYAAQLYAAMEKDIPQLDKKIASGHLEIVKDWLKQKIHRHGKTYKADELIKKITGEPLNSRYFCDYLEKKYKDIYSL